MTKAGFNDKAKNNAAEFDRVFGRVTFVDVQEVHDILKQEGASALRLRNRNDETALFFCADFNRVDASLLLLEKGIDVNAVNNKGETAAFYCTDVTILKAMARQKADFNHIRSDGDSLLGHFCDRQNFIKKNDVELTTLLIDNGADVNKPDGNGFSPLMRAAFNNKPELVKLFMKRGADPTYKKDGKTVGDLLGLYPECKEMAQLIESLSTNKFEKSHKKNPGAKK